VTRHLFAPLLLAAAANACARSDAQLPRHDHGSTSVATGFGADYVAKLESVQTHGEWVTFKGAGKDSVKAYIAYPMRKDAAPAIVVIHEIFGLSDWIRTVVDDFATRGYVAIAPDLLTRRGGTVSADSARKLIGTLPPDSITADLDATVAYVKGLKAVKGNEIATIGFCWGGGQSFRYATNNPNLKAAVVCYGPTPDLATVGKIKAAVYGAYAGEDARINASLPDLEKAMQSAGKTFPHKIYPAARHGFFRSRGENPNGGEKNAAEAAQADTGWADIQAFLKKQLGN
jgi:carboxymethylenebutenolidase